MIPKDSLSLNSLQYAKFSPKLQSKKCRFTKNQMGPTIPQNKA